MHLLVRGAAAAAGWFLYRDTVTFLSSFLSEMILDAATLLKLLRSLSVSDAVESSNEGRDCAVLLANPGAGGARWLSCEGDLCGAGVGCGTGASAAR